MEPNETDESAPAEAAAPAPVSRLPLVAMGALVVLAILVAIGLGLRGNRSFPAGSPEDALQQFLEAGLDGDEDATVALMVPEARDDCTDRLEPQYGPRSTRGLGFELDATATGRTQRIFLAFRSVPYAISLISIRMMG